MNTMHPANRQPTIYYLFQVFFLILDNILSIMGRYSIEKNHSDVLIELSRKAKTLRKSLKLTQQALSERSGVSYGSIKRFESTGQISLESLLRIAHVFDRLEDFDLVFALDEDSDVNKLFTI